MNNRLQELLDNECEYQEQAVIADEQKDTWMTQQEINFLDEPCNESI